MPAWLRVIAATPTPQRPLIVFFSTTPPSLLTWVHTGRGLWCTVYGERWSLFCNWLRKSQSDRVHRGFHTGILAMGSGDLGVLWQYMEIANRDSLTTHHAQGPWLLATGAYRRRWQGLQMACSIFRSERRYQMGPELKSISSGRGDVVIRAFDFVEHFENCRCSCVSSSTAPSS